MNAMRDWYLSRTLRERWLIGAMVAIALTLLAWLLVYRPLMTALEQARQRHVAAVRDHGLVQVRLAQLRTAARPSPGGASSAPLSLRVTEAAARAGVALSANEPRGAGSALITLAPAAPTTALRWLRELESSGIVVREIGITPQGDAQVVVTAVLAQGSGR